MAPGRKPVTAAMLSAALFFLISGFSAFTQTREVVYRYDTLSAGGRLALRQYAEPQVEIVLSINRISEDRLKQGLVLIVPDTIIPNRLYYSPLPDSVAAAEHLPKCILVSQRIQAFGAYEHGVLVRWGPLSTGKKSTPTPNGIFHTNWKARLKISSIDSSWIMPWYFNIESRRGIAFHEYTLPGYPASHACIRLLQADAIWIYNWAEGWTLEKRTREIIKNGTPVIIYGKYSYTTLPPWKYLVTNPLSTEITSREQHEVDSCLMNIW